MVPPNSENAMKIGCFGTKNGTKMIQKWVFPKMSLHHLGCTNKGNEAFLSAVHCSQYSILVRARVGVA